MSEKRRKSYFTVKKLKNIIFNVREDEKNTYMPNEIFNDLNEGFKDEEKAKSSTHIAFAYSYIYLAHYMYRYCKYDYYSNYYSQLYIDEKMIKQILGFPAKADQYTYITKKGGILDKLGYIRKESDVPIEPVIVNAVGENILEIYTGKGMPLEMELAEAAKSGGEFKISHFIMESRYREVYGNSKNRKINFPIKAFFRDNEWCEDETDDDRTGTFWSIENTHIINFDVFIFCMADAELGVKGFYLYCFMLYMNDKHSSGFDCSINRLVTLTGLGMKTVREQLVRLEERNMITNDHKPYCLGKKYWQITKTNTYKVLSHNEFISDMSKFNLIQKQRRI
ncbi:hypothetical protein, partial [Sporosarcina sp. BP05]|uniref:hypothetical protein n=1 Tax=Sporosarcina sp. BP05 TaxID=2758726 RepID=UPI001647AC5F